MTAKVIELDAAHRRMLEERDAENDRFVRERMRANREEWARSVAHKLGLSEDDATLLAQNKQHTSEAIRAVQGLMKSGAHGLILGGPVGLGKTFAAAYAWLRKPPGSAALFIKASDIRRKVLPFSNDGEPIDLSTELIVIDDIGAETLDDKGYWAEAFLRFLDARRGTGKTIFTTNLSPKSLLSRYCARTQSRLMVFTFAALGGSDLRPRGKGWV